MSTKVERLRYYERQYLRSFDFTAEQSYHLEMRRRLNLALHLWGIVDGLELLKGELIPGAPEQFYVSPGMAIDGYGREILMPNPHPLSPDDLRANQINTAGLYGVWIAYERKAATPPSPGYRVCDLDEAEQYTRWLEGYRLLLKPTSDALRTMEDPDDDAALPAVSGALPEDTLDAAWPVRLGTVSVSNVSGSLQIADAYAEERSYVGSRTQRIWAPGYIDPAGPVPAPPPPSFELLKASAALDPPLSVAVQSNLFAERNLIVGGNFEVDQSKIKPAPSTPPPFPAPDGNVKVTSDLFLQGGLYVPSGSDWLRLDEYVKTLMPEVQIGTATLVPVPGANPSVGTEVVTVTTSLPSVSSSSLCVSLAGIEWASWDDFFDWLGIVDGFGVDHDVPVRLNVSVVGPPNVNNQDHEFTVRWEVGPRSDAAGSSPPALNVRAITVSYVAVFYR